MSRNRTLLILVIIGVLGAFLVYWLVPNEFQSWQVTYNKQSNEPYATGLLVDWFEESDIELEINQNPLSEILPNEDRDVDILFIDWVFTADSAESQALLSHIAKGNRAFISSQYMSRTFMKHLFYADTADYADVLNLPKEIDDQEIYFQDVETNRSAWSSLFKMMDSSITVHFNGDSLHYAHRDAFKYYAEFYEFWGVDELRPNFHRGEVLNVFNDHYIYHFRVKYGEGYVYFHSLPITLTNYGLKRENGREYAKNMLQPISQGPIIFDEYNAYWHNDDLPNNQPNLSKGPLSFILQNQALRWAYYTLLVMALLYVMVSGKRKQRVVPVLTKNRNTTLSYVETLGELYFQDGNHKVIAEKAISLFLLDLRQRYGMNTKDINEKFYTRLSQRSGVEKNRIERIFNMFKLTEKISEFSDKNLTTIQQSITEFYHYAK
jgi:hypothetical protein